MTRKDRIEAIMVKMLVCNYEREGVPNAIPDWLLDQAYNTAKSIVYFVDRKIETSEA